MTILLFLPYLITILWLNFALHAKITEYTPAESDPRSYWVQANAFRNAGFNGGYFGYNDVPSRSGIFRFGAHGPAFPILQGTFGKVFGWHLYSPIIFNITIVTLALLIFLLMLKPGLPTILALVVMLCLFWPIAYFLPLGFQEALHIAIAIMLGGAFICLIKWGGTDVRFFIALFILISAAAFVRRSWALLYLPLSAIYILRKRSYVSWSTIPISVGLLIGWQLTAAWLGAPFPISFVRGIQGTILTRFHQTTYDLFTHTLDNIGRFWQGGKMWILLRSEMLVLVLACLAWLMVKDKVGLAQKKEEGIFHVLNLGLIFIAQFVLYEIEQGKDFRVWVPHLLLSTILFVYFNRKFFVVLLLVASLVSLPVFTKFYQRVGKYYNYPIAKIAIFREQVEKYIVFDPQADPWCNTVVFEKTNLNTPVLAALPGGTGTMLNMGPGFWNTPLKSRYILTAVDIEAIFDVEVHVQKIRSTNLGDLYINLDAHVACPPNPAIEKKLSGDKSQ